MISNSMGWKCRSMKAINYCEVIMYVENMGPVFPKLGHGVFTLLLTVNDDVFVLLTEPSVM